MFCAVVEVCTISLAEFTILCARFVGSITVHCALLVTERGAIDYFDLTREGELDWHNDWETCHDKGYSTELITKEAVSYTHLDVYKRQLSGPLRIVVEEHVDWKRQNARITYYQPG